MGKLGWSNPEVSAMGLGCTGTSLSYDSPEEPRDGAEQAAGLVPPAYTVPICEGGVHLGLGLNAGGRAVDGIGHIDRAVLVPKYRRLFRGQCEPAAGRVGGDAPRVQYLANWRMQVAAQELLDSRKSISRIAQEIGYDTDASFTRAFKRRMGAPPATWRRQSR